MTEKLKYYNILWIIYIRIVNIRIFCMRVLYISIFYIGVHDDKILLCLLWYQFNTCNSYQYINSVDIYVFDTLSLLSHWYYYEESQQCHQKNVGRNIVVHFKCQHICWHIDDHFMSIFVLLSWRIYRGWMDLDKSQRISRDLPDTSALINIYDMLGCSKACYGGLLLCAGKQ